MDDPDEYAIPRGPLAPDAEPFPVAVHTLTAFSFETTDPNCWITAVMCPHGERAIRRWHLDEPGLTTVEARGRAALIWWRRAVRALDCPCGADARAIEPDAGGRVVG